MYNSIALSGLPGAGKDTLARRLEKETGWPVHSVGGLFRARYAMERPDVSFEQWWPDQPRETLVETNLAFRQKVAAGEIIADTRYVLAMMGLPTLRIFLTADLSTRGQRLLGHPRYERKTAKEIEYVLQGREADELYMGRDLFNCPDYDYREPGLYHVVLDTTHMTLCDEVTAVLLALGKHPQSPDSQDS